MEVVGFSIWSLVFSALEIGLLTVHIRSAKKFKDKGVKRFAILTMMFIVLNGTMVYLSLVSNFNDLIGIIRSINSLAIAVYLFALIFDPLIKDESDLKRTPWLFVSVAIAIGLQGLSQFIPDGVSDFSSALTIALPVMLSVTLIAFLVRNRMEEQLMPQFTIVVLLFFAIITLGSFALYFDLAHLVLDIPLNIIFLLVTGLFYLNANRDKSSNEQPVNSAERVTSLDHVNFDELGLTKTQKEIVEMIVVERLDYTEISEKRNIAYNTVTSHATHIFRRIGEKYDVSITRKEELIEFLLSLDITDE